MYGEEDERQEDGRDEESQGADRILRHETTQEEGPVDPAAWDRFMEALTRLLS